MISRSNELAVVYRPTGNLIPFGRGHYHVQHEPCWYAVRKNGTGHGRSFDQITTERVRGSPGRASTYDGDSAAAADRSPQTAAVEAS
jgi:hypothetical protein